MKLFKFIIGLVSATSLLTSPVAFASPAIFQPIKNDMPGSNELKLAQLFDIEMQPCAFNGLTPELRINFQTKTSGWQVVYDGFVTGFGTKEYIPSPLISADLSGDTITVLKIIAQVCENKKTPAIKIIPKDPEKSTIIFGNPVDQQAFDTAFKIIEIPTELFNVKMYACKDGQFSAIRVNGPYYGTNMMDPARDNAMVPFMTVPKVKNPADKTKMVDLELQKCLDGDMPKYEFIILPPVAGSPTPATNPINPAAIQHGGIVPDCNPSLPPNTPYSANETDPSKIPCGLNKFIELIQNIIKYMSLVVIPIAVLMIGWGGFQILTSAGSEEKLGAGKKSIITAVTGIVIILVGYLVIKFVFQLLGVTSEFSGSLFK